MDDVMADEEADESAVAMDDVMADDVAMANKLAEESSEVAEDLEEESEKPKGKAVAVGKGFCSSYDYSSVVRGVGKEPEECYKVLKGKCKNAYFIHTKAHRGVCMCCKKFPFKYR